jgi:hypothetical protein
MSDDPIFCARCFKELPAMPSNSQEISCPSCGKDISLVTDFVTTRAMEERRAALRVLWEDARADGLIRETKP